MSDTTFFRVDGFSAVRHDKETVVNLAELKERNKGVSQSTIVRRAIIRYASKYGYGGDNAVQAMEYIKDKVGMLLEQNEFSHSIVQISASNVIKEAIANEARKPF